MSWAYYPAESIRTVTNHVCAVRGMACACREMLLIATDEELTPEQRLAELGKYQQDSVLYHPRKPFPVRPSYQPRIRKDGSEEYKLLTAMLEEEARHGYIRGRHIAAGQIYGMVLYEHGRSAEEILRGIVAFCEATLDIIGGDNGDAE